MMDNNVCTPKERTPVMGSHPISNSAYKTTPQQAHHTPVKSIAGQHFNSQQYRTPTTRLASRQQFNGTGSSSGIPNGVMSPRLHTPSSIPGSAGSGRLLPGSGHRHATRYCTPQSGVGKKLLLTPKHLTPQGPNGRGYVYNPFEGHNPADLLQGSLLSPNVFVPAGNSGMEHTPKEFCWTVDEMAMLKPVDIDENALEAQSIRCNPEMEEKAQQAIDKYFSSNVIVPSPWTESAKKKPFYLPRTPGAHSADSPMVLKPKTTAHPSEGLILVKDASCQTGLSLPMDFDLEKILGDYYSSHDKDSGHSQGSGDSQEDHINGDVLSTSSLRRKLFFHGDNANPPSPVRPSHIVPGSSSRDPQTPAVSTSPDQSIASMHFSSSPIRGHVDNESSSLHLMTPAIRRCSTAPDLMESPDLSPINTGHKPSSHTVCSDSMHGVLMTPLRHRLQGTPSPQSSSSSNHHFHSFPMSPGMSPIVLAQPGTQPSLHSSSNSSGPHWGTETQKSHSPGPLHPHSSPELSLIRHESAREDMSVQHMDTGEEYPPFRLDAFCDKDRESPVVFYAREDRDYQDDCSEQGLQTHDTGYQTNSLQSTTNLDTMGLLSNNVTSLDGVDATGFTNAGILHTDLTVQFCSMPLSCHDYETEMKGEGLSKEPSEAAVSISSAPLPVKTNIPRKVTRITTPATSSFSFSNILQSEPADVHYDEDEIMRKAHEALGRTSQTTSSNFTSFLKDPNVLKQKLMSHAGYSGKPVSSSSALYQEKIFGERTVPTKMLPSEQASYALKRAEKDYEKFCSHTADVGAETFYFSASEASKADLFSDEALS